MTNIPNSQSNLTSQNGASLPVTMKDLRAADPRWCTGCGDYMIVTGMRKFIVQEQLRPESTVNISGIGCSGRFPHYMQTYGLHGIHGRAIPLATGIALTRPDLTLFIESGDGDALSIGGTHFIHGIKKNFNCVFLLFDNQIYGLTKNQTSPTTVKGLPTQSQPEGSLMDPLNPIRLAIGLGASFVASTAEWLGNHFVDTLEKAYQHKGFSFVHVAQRCPKFNPGAWDFKTSNWISFIEHEAGIKADLKGAPDASVLSHDPSDLEAAFKQSLNVSKTFGLFYQSTSMPTYDQVIRDQVAKAPKKQRSTLLNSYLI